MFTRRNCHQSFLTDNFFSPPKLFLNQLSWFQIKHASTIVYCARRWQHCRSEMQSDSASAMAAAAAAAAAPLNELKIADGALVLNTCELVGDITIGSGCVVGPRATIRAEAGPVFIGDNCLIEEGVHIINRHKAHQDDLHSRNVMLIGDNNHFETNSRIECVGVGASNTVGMGAVLEKGSFVPNNCYIAPGITIAAGTTVADSTCLTMSPYTQYEIERKVTSDRQAELQMRLDYLRKILPNYHNIVKWSSTSTTMPTTRR